MTNEQVQIIKAVNQSMIKLAKLESFTEYAINQLVGIDPNDLTTAEKNILRRYYDDVSSDVLIKHSQEKRSI